MADNLSKDDFYKFKDELFEKLDKKYVTREEFKIVRSIAYGIVGTTALTVLAAILSKVVMAGS